MIMYKYSIFFFCVFVVSVFMRGTVDAQYLRAHNAYAQKDYQGALELLSGLSENSFPIIYNLAWAHYKNGNYYQAMNTFLKAVRIGSGSDRVCAYTLYEQMKQKLALSYDTNQYKIFLKKIFLRIPTFILQILSFIMLLITLLCFVVYKGKRFVCIGLLICAVCSTASLYYRYTELTKTVMLANKEKVAVYTGPDEQYGIVAMVPLGTHFSVISTQQLWHCVCFDQQRGWVHAQDLDLIT